MCPQNYLILSSKVARLSEIFERTLCRRVSKLNIDYLQSSIMKGLDGHLSHKCTTHYLCYFILLLAAPLKLEIVTTELKAKESSTTVD